MEWRWGRGWSPDELEARLQRVARLPLNYTQDPREMTRENGWNHVASQAVIGHEAPGPVLSGDVFARARQAMETLQFSDPRIAQQHFRHDRPIEGQTVLLELRAMGLHILASTRVSETRFESTDRETVTGFCFDTCAGHIESGREWFLLTKDLQTGAVRFRIQAAWRAGDFPNAWMELGFHLVGRRYQRAWHRLAYRRLREGVHPAMSASVTERTPVQFWAQLGIPSAMTDVEMERERMRRDRWWVSAGVGALAGMRSMMAPTVVAIGARRLNARNGGHVVKGWVPVLATLALGEVVADKLPFTPSRMSPMVLTGRVLAGALSGYSIAKRGQRPAWIGGLLGAAAAVVASALLVRVRQAALDKGPTTGFAVAIAEDALAVASGAALVWAQR